jgi:hypothetical protein
MEQANVFDLFFQAAGFAATVKTAEAGTTRSEGPAGNGYLEVDEFLNDGLDAGQPFGEKRQPAAMILQQRMIVLLDGMFLYLHNYGK